VSTARLTRLRAALADLDVGAVLLGPGSDLRWATGLDAHASERLTMLVVPAVGDAILVVPELEASLARRAGVDGLARLVAWTETQDPVALVADHLHACDVAAGTLAIQDRIWSQFTLALQARLPMAAWVPGSRVMAPLRVVKDADEIAALHAAGAAIDEVHAQVPALLRPGRTEAAVAADIDTLIRSTHDTTSFVIVASGPNGASPHHGWSDRVLEDGDAVVVDIGGTLDGYGSDETRNYCIGHVDPAYRALHDVLEEAQRAATAAVTPGTSADTIDAAARDVIAAAGHGSHFIHRTGHGIGLDGHEEPWIVAGNPTPVQPGMAFSIEPGIYVPGRYGARIEDIVVVVADGAEPVNHRPRGITVT
jgi:Xaa-Pro aminopeptidase